MAFQRHFESSGRRISVMYRKVLGEVVQLTYVVQVAAIMYLQFHLRSYIRTAWLLPLRLWSRCLVVCIPRGVYQLSNLRNRRQRYLVFKEHCLEGQEWVLLVSASWTALRGKAFIGDSSSVVSMPSHGWMSALT